MPIHTYIYIYTCFAMFFTPTEAFVMAREARAVRTTKRRRSRDLRLETTEAFLANVQDSRSNCSLYPNGGN